MRHFNTKKEETLFKQIESIYGDSIFFSYEDYKNDRIKMKFICKEHGEFYQYPGHIIKRHGCQKCSKKSRISEYEFIEKANKIHNNKYSYGEYKNKITKMKIVCPIHGEFYQLPKHHLNGVGCKECNESRGERKIKQMLENLNIKFERDKRFDECRYKKPLPFDFYLKDKNLCIEYDGIQHSQIIERFGGEEGFKELQIRDKIKTNFCIKNDIKLIRINYKESIEECLKILN